MDLSDEMRIFQSVLVHYAVVLKEKTLNDADFKIVVKNSELSELARKEGNALFSTNKHNDQLHKQIFAHYCRSIVLAPLKSEQLAFAYGNRSAFLMHLGRYNECIIDIDRALDIAMSNHFKVKLLCRKVECLKALGKPYENILKDCQACAQKINHKDKNKDKISELLNKTIQPQLKSFPEVMIDCEDHRLKNAKSLPKKIMNHSDHVIINYNQKYGRHLIAARDFKPGEIIFGEEIYTSILSFEQNDTICAHCFKMCWTGVACDYCSWMFCSEKCKEEAWNRYHDIECKAFVVLTELEKPNDPEPFLALRLLIMGIKEMGSIANLRKNLKSLDRCLDPSSESLFNNGKVISKTFKNIYLLKIKMDLTKRDTQQYGYFVLRDLLYLVKTTSLFGENHKMEDIFGFITNEDIRFAGMLLCKLVSVTKIHSHYISNPNPELRYDSKFTGTFMPILSSLTNHSCFPNIQKIFTLDRRIIVFAVRPIKKNSQIFESYLGSEFHRATKHDRIKMRKGCHWKCDCTPCTENWLTIEGMLQQDMLKQNKLLQDMLQEIMPYELLRTTLDNAILNKYEYDDLLEGTQFSQNDVNILSKHIIKYLTNSIQPNVAAMLLIDTLCAVLNNMYVEKYNSINFGVCKFMKAIENCYDVHM